MIKKLIIITNLLLLYTAILDLPPEAWAGMTGSSYSVPSAVIAGGGRPASSTNFQSDSTLAQPSPLPEQIPSMTGTFGLYPGFWQTLTGQCDGSPTCLDAQFTYEADSTVSGQVKFFDQSSCPDTCSYDWDFGDGNVGSGAFTSNVYTVIPTCEDLAGSDGVVDTCVGGPNAGGACAIATVAADCGYPPQRASIISKTTPIIVPT